MVVLGMGIGFFCGILLMHFLAAARIGNNSRTKPDKAEVANHSNEALAWRDASCIRANRVQLVLPQRLATRLSEMVRIT